MAFNFSFLDNAIRQALADRQKFLLENTEAGGVAQTLDAKDGSVNGQIDASVWNEFADQFGGNHVNNFITTESAMNSITTYMVEAEARNKTALVDAAKKSIDNGCSPKEVMAKLEKLDPKMFALVKAELEGYTGINNSEPSYCEPEYGNE